MALDSKAKRFSVPGVARPWMRSQYPDAAIGRAARASVGNVYPVANFQAPGPAPTGPPVGTFTLMGVGK